MPIGGLNSYKISIQGCEERMNNIQLGGVRNLNYVFVKESSLHTLESWRDDFSFLKGGIY